MSGLIDFLEDRAPWPAMIASGGTPLDPLVQLMEKLHREGDIAPNIVLYTDRQFQDVHEKDVLETLNQYGTIQHVDFSD